MRAYSKKTRLLSHETVALSGDLLALEREADETARLGRKRDSNVITLFPDEAVLQES